MREIVRESRSSSDEQELILLKIWGKVTIFYSKSSVQWRNFSTPSSPNFSKL